MKEVKKQKPASQSEQRRQAVLAAIPDVRELVKKHGLSVVNSCLTRLREYDKKQRQAQKLRDEADELERALEGSKELKLRSA